jgi:hypothetical protein
VPFFELAQLGVQGVVVAVADLWVVEHVVTVIVSPDLFG